MPCATKPGLPPATEKANHDRFMANVAAFEAANSDIKLDVREGKMDPQTFPANWRDIENTTSTFTITRN